VHDQAAQLRALIADKKPPATLTARTVAITSGKGGVGKTSMAANLSIALTKFGKKVVVIDVDLGLANIDVLLGLRPTYTMEHVLRGEKTVQEVVINDVYGVDIIPASSGVEQLAELTDCQRERLLDGFEALESDYDIVLIDTAAGVSANVLSFTLASNEIIVLTTPEPTAFTDAYAMIKVLSRYRPEAPLHLVVNMARTEDEAVRTVRNIRRVAKHFLDVEVRDFGYVPYDEMVARAARKQRPFVEGLSAHPAAEAVRALAARVSGNNVSKRDERGLTGFIRRAMEVSRHADQLGLAS